MVALPDTIRTIIIRLSSALLPYNSTETPFYLYKKKEKRNHSASIKCMYYTHHTKNSTCCNKRIWYYEYSQSYEAAICNHLTRSIIV